MLKRTIDIFRWFLRLLQNITVMFANTPRRVPRKYSQFSTWDLLKAHRMSTRIHDGERVLDVGCGTGRRIVELEMFRRIECFGVDIYLRGAFPGLKISQFDGKKLNFPDNSFDVSLICYVLHHLTSDHAQELLCEVVRVTRREVIVLEDSMPYWSMSYRLRNRIHRLETDLQYSTESETFSSPLDESMFLTYDEWKSRLKRLPRVKNIVVEPLLEISRFAHHTMFALELEKPTLTVKQPSFNSAQIQ